MANGGGDPGPHVSALPEASGGAVPNGGRSANKRLLPTELRRRRRAAKLQITSERDVATVSAREIIASIDDRHTPDDTMPDKATSNAAPDTPLGVSTDSTKNLPSDSHLESKLPTPPTRFKPAETNDSSTPHADESARSTPAPTSSASKRIQNLFSFSLQDRKRQRLLHLESLVEVPTSMKVERVPLDLAPKSKVVITMSFPFPFGRPRAASIAAAMATQGSDSHEVRWLRALQYYVHPASPLPSSLNSTTDRQLDEGDFYVNRFRVWQDAFRCAYFGLRRQKHDGTLYVRYPEFIACFYVDSATAKERITSKSIADLCRSYATNRDEDGERASLPSSRLCAVVSQSNARLRKDLQRRDVEFRVPFNLRALQKAVSSLHLNDEGIGDPQMPVFGSEQNVHGPDSFLHFSGHHAVHGLYEFLMNRKPLSNQDVPEIVASQPFYNTAIQSIAVRYMGKAGGRSAAAQEQDSSGVAHHRSEVELSGFCSPSAVASLLTCLEDHHRASTSSVERSVALKAAMETAPLCERLNGMFLDDTIGSFATGGKTVQEREEWKQQLEFAKRRLQSIKKTTTDGNEVIEIDMASR